MPQREILDPPLNYCVLLTTVEEIPVHEMTQISGLLAFVKHNQKYINSLYLPPVENTKKLYLKQVMGEWCDLAKTVYECD